MKEYKEIDFKKMIPISMKCDKCQKEFTKEDLIEWQEAYQFEFVAGFGSVFGDGNVVECDLCQSCLKDLIGEYVRISDRWEVA
jgi:nitric oxide reductase large subunit